MARTLQAETILCSPLSSERDKVLHAFGGRVRVTATLPPAAGRLVPAGGVGGDITDFGKVDEVNFHFQKGVEKFSAVNHILFLEKGLFLFEGKIQAVGEPVHKLAELVTQVPVRFLF
jgi:hypothetical protein